MSASELEDLQRRSGLVGEDAAVFSFEEQSLKSWGAFLAVLGTVLTALYFLWLNPDTGFGEYSVWVAISFFLRQALAFSASWGVNKVQGQILLLAVGFAAVPSRRSPPIFLCVGFETPLNGNNDQIHAWVRLRVLPSSLEYAFISPHPCRFGLGDDFVRSLEGVSGGDSTITITLILGIFAVAHSGLASLRPKVCIATIVY